MNYALMLCALLALPAQAMVSGNDLLTKIKNSKNTTASGNTDLSFVAGYLAGILDSPIEGMCLPAGVNIMQLMDMTERTLLERAESRHLLGSAFVGVTIQRAWPCPPKDKSK